MPCHHVQEANAIVQRILEELYSLRRTKDEFEAMTRANKEICAVKAKEIASLRYASIFLTRLCFSPMFGRTLHFISERYQAVIHANL